MRRVIAIAGAALWLSGCFVFEELDKGDAIIEQHSAGLRKKRKEAEAAAAAAAEADERRTASSPQGPDIRARLAEWWRNALEDDREEAAPDDAIVRCELHGSLIFTRESDCQARGGELTRVEPKGEGQGPKGEG